ncbi:MAG TPA: SRPBCC family protein [Mycobacteriales bacterium]|nr:SRPBCC family protein [Mycobacteriales bacterium]
MGWNDYRFRTEWRVPAGPDEAYAVLAALEEYPRWWPEVRRVELEGEEAYRVTVRALLPYELVSVVREDRRDPVAGVLEARMTGDVSGFSRWTVHPDGDGALLVFEEEVEAGKRLLRRLAFVARPAFRANHMLMMRHGERGLRTYLAGYRLGRAHPGMP